MTKATTNNFANVSTVWQILITYKEKIVWCEKGLQIFYCYKCRAGLAPIFHVKSALSDTVEKLQVPLYPVYRV